MKCRSSRRICVPGLLPFYTLFLLMLTVPCKWGWRAGAAASPDPGLSRCAGAGAPSSSLLAPLCWGVTSLVCSGPSACEPCQPGLRALRSGLPTVAASWTLGTRQVTLNIWSCLSQ